MNKVILVGNLTKDPELTTTQSGTDVAIFTIAVQRKFKNANDEYESDFINCVAWRSSAEFIHKYFNKGNKIGVVGRIQTRSYDVEDGTKRYVTEVVVEECEFVQSKKGDSNNQAEDTKPEFEPIDDDNSPF